MAYKTSKSYYHAHWVTCNPVSPGIPGPSTIVAGPNYVWDTIKSGSSVWGWKHKLQTQQDATSSYNVSDMTISQTPGYSRYDHYRNYFGSPKAVFSSVEGNFCPIIYPDVYSGSEVNQAVNQLLTEFMGKCRKRQTQFSGMTFVGELRQTIHMLKHAHGSVNEQIMKYLDRLRRGKTYRSHVDRKKFVRDKYLEGVFGWLPFVGDVQDAAKAMGDIITRERDQSIVRFTGGRQIPFGSLALNDFYAVNSILHRLTSRSQVDLKVMSIAAVQLEVAGPGRWADSLGFDFDDFVPTLWELIPFSWAVDYFFNVGKILEASCWGLSHLAWNSRTIVKSTECISTLCISDEAMKFQPNYISTRGGPATSKVSVFELARTPITKLPSLAVEVDLGPKKVANMAAVASQHEIVSKLLRT